MIGVAIRQFLGAVPDAISGLPSRSASAGVGTSDTPQMRQIVFGSTVLYPVGHARLTDSAAPAASRLDYVLGRDPGHRTD